MKLKRQSAGEAEATINIKEKNSHLYVERQWERREVGARYLRNKEMHEKKSQLGVANQLLQK